jgi:predicted DNA-binding protein
MKIIKGQRPELVSYTQRLSRDLAERLDAEARTSGVNRTALVCAIIERALEAKSFVVRVRK